MATPAPAAPQLITDIYDGDDDTVDTVVEPAKPPVAPKPKLDPSLRAMAEDFGLSAEQIEESEPGQLSAYLRGRVRQMHESGRERQQDQAREVAVKQAQQVQPQPPKEETFDLDPADYDPKVYARLKSGWDAEQRLKKLEGRVDSYESREQARASQSLESVVDDAFDDLGKDYERAFGAGAMGELDRAGVEFARRQSVYAVASQRLPQNPTPRQIRRAVRTAAEQLYGQVIPPAPPAKPASVGAYGSLPGGRQVRPDAPPPIRDAQGRIVSRAVAQSIADDYALAEPWATEAAAPTHRQLREDVPGHKKATASVDSLLRDQDRQTDFGHSGSTTLDEFPD